MIGSILMPNLSVALDTLTEIVRTKREWLTSSAVTMLKLGLQALYVDLDYRNRPVGSGIPDEEVPLLRYRCAALAFALVQANIVETEADSRIWLEATKNDPLPELRLQRYRFNEDETILSE